MISRLLFIFCILPGLVHSQKAEESGPYGLNWDHLQEGIRNAKLPRDKALFITTYTNMGKIRLHQGNYEEALNLLMKAKSLNKEDSSSLTPYYAAFGALFAEIGAYDGAVEYEKRIFNRHKLNLNRYYSAANIGLMYLKMYMYDSAMVYFENQRQIAFRMHDYIAEASALNNAAFGLTEQGKYREAKDKLLETLHLLKTRNGEKSPYFQNEVPDFHFTVKENLARCYYHLGEFRKTADLLQYTTKHCNPDKIDRYKKILISSYLKLGLSKKAEQLIRRLKKNGDQSSLESRKTLYQIELEHATHNNDLKKIIRLTNRITELQDELEKEQNLSRNRMNQMISHYLISESAAHLQREKDIKNVAIKRLSIEKRQSTFFVIALISAVILLTLTLILFAQFSKIRKKKIVIEKEQLRLFNEKQELKIRKQESYLTEYALDFSKNREFELSIIKNLQGIADQQASSASVEIKSLIADLHQKQQIDKRAEDLAIESQNLLAEFRYTLQQRHPDLKKSDIQLCYLFRLELTNKEIAVIKNVAPNSIKIFKNRLKNKLKLSSTESLTDYLKSI